ncbi:hypothetical protein ACNQ1X_01930 [Mycoplasma sp. SK341A]|uniref:hypothetical protein n=1 Tax=unclassified Mycoplasma TaxID=2683645 RepID=UPI003A8AA1AD
METELKLFEIYQMNDEIGNLIAQQEQIESNYVMPILVSKTDILFCEVKKIKTYPENTICKQLLIYTWSQITNYVVEFKTIYKIPLRIFIEKFTNIHNEIIGEKIAESNELELLDAFVQVLEQKLKISKLISINIKPKSNNNCY